MHRVTTFIVSLFCFSAIALAQEAAGDAAAPATPPTTQPAPQEDLGPAPKVYVTWKIKGWFLSRDPQGDPASFTGICQVRLEKMVPGPMLEGRPTQNGMWGGVNVGRPAKSLEDKTFDTYLKKYTKQFNLESGVAPVKPTSITINNLSFYKMHAQYRDNLFNVYIGVQDGFCISYWYCGDSARQMEFEKAVGTAKIEASKNVKAEK